MIVRKLKQHQYERLNTFLVKKASTTPVDASYTVGMTLNGVEYSVKVQPERHNKMAVLQALQIDRNDEAPGFELITGGNLLSSLLEILLYQEAGR
ncbi:hypothetical protein DFR58_111107 [Anaerobacterium chartisolvens]|uniref:Uncharacterized protein n=1 Tax=Anaerobacterium chartisolvens TaxID=1297424 RepID=A0A369B485_9FIRM|nr:hypothetical protein [Anaerobacterium chartisolvens]RCX16362.1 hypothetical protein DFR58_111107 [Anaerobacterium chartisolvens]